MQKPLTINPTTEVQKPLSMNQFLSVVEKLSADKEKLTGNGRLDMSELVTALQNFQDPSSPPATTKTSDTFQSQVNINIAPTAPTVSSSAPKFSHVNFKPVKNISRQETLAKSEETYKVDADKCSVLKSNHANFNSVPKSFVANNFNDEKNNLLGELKTKLNMSDDDQKEYDANATKRNFAPTNPDQVVNKIVYNQYREMLNSYNRVNK